MLEVADILAQAKVAGRDQLVAQMRNRRLLHRLGVSGRTIEGYLYPDTYKLRQKTAIACKLLVRSTTEELQDLELDTLVFVITRMATIKWEAGKKGGWVLVDMITPGPRYQGEAFFKRAIDEGFSSFDSGYFSRHLAGELNRSFIQMLLMVGGVTLVVLSFYFLDWQCSSELYASATRAIVTSGREGQFPLLVLPLASRQSVSR